MGKKLISILICTLPNRTGSLTHLLNELNDQIDHDHLSEHVEVLYLGDFKTMTVGAKRNALINASTGDNLAFIDDDDEVSPNYINALFEAVMLSPHVDVYNFTVEITQCGKDPKPVYYSKDFLRDQNFSNHYQRIPNHLMLIKADHVRCTPYKDINFKEDADFSARLLPLLRTEIVIDEILYYYKADPFNSETLPEDIRQQVIKHLKPPPPPPPPPRKIKRTW